MARGLDHMQQLHEMCAQELKELQLNIESYRKSSEKILEILSDHWEEIHNNSSVIALIAYDNFQTSVTNIMDTARKFNIHLHIHNLETTRSSAQTLQVMDVPASFGKNISDNKNGISEVNAASPTTAVVKAKAEINCGKAVKKQGKPSKPKFKSEKLNVRQPQQQPQRRAKEQSPTTLVPSAANGYDSLNSILPIEENDSYSAIDFEYSKCRFHYTEKDLSIYKPGYLIDASVTYIKDLETLCFYICDTKSAELSRVLELNRKLGLRQYTALPPENEIFGIVLDGMILRAVRENDIDLQVPNENKCVVHKALLLDFGDIIEVSVSNIMYRLTEEYQKTPAQAIKCQLHRIGTGDGDNSGNGAINEQQLSCDELRQNLQQLGYKKVKFCVVANEENTLHLQLIDDSNYNSASLTNCNSGITIHTNSSIKSTNPFKQNLLPIAAADYSVAEEAIPLPALPRNMRTDEYIDGLTREEWEMLYEEEQCTSNAMKAVMGYDPKDDQRLCRFYNPKTGCCFKGANCKQDHAPKNPDGWTNDVLPASSIIDTRIPSITYSHGAIINITPTYVGQLERFYAQINDPKVPAEPLIWNSEDINKLQLLQKPPLTFELVLARYEDGLWYRAKVIESDEITKMIKVFYVDYGNNQIVHLRDLARCDLATAHIPFQAHLCRIANVRDATKTAEQRKNGVNKLCKLILNKSFEVKVLGNFEDLIVSFIGEKFANVPRNMINAGFLKPFEMINA